MKLTKSRFLIFALLAACALFLASCGEGTNGADRNDTPSANGTSGIDVDTSNGTNEGGMPYANGMDTPHTTGTNANDGYADAGTIASIGGTVASGGLQFTLDRVERFESDGMFASTPREGHEIIILWLTVQNVAAEDLFINMFYTVAYLDGFSVTETFVMGVEGDTIWGNVSSGRGRRGYVAFELPLGWSKLEWRYSDWFTDDEAVIFTVTADDVA